MVLIHNLLEAYTKVWRNMYIPHWICGNTPPLPPRSSSVVLLGMCNDLRENLRWANVNGASEFPAPKPGQFSGLLQSVYYSSCAPDLLMWWTIMRCFYLIGVVAGFSRENGTWSHITHTGRQRKRMHSAWALLSSHLIPTHLPPPKKTPPLFKNASRPVTHWTPFVRFLSTTGKAGLLQVERRVWQERATAWHLAKRGNECWGDLPQGKGKGARWGLDEKLKNLFLKTCYWWRAPFHQPRHVIHWVSKPKHTVNLKRAMAES